MSEPACRTVRDAHFTVGGCDPMITTPRYRRMRASRRLLGVESLESRHLLSVTLPPGIASVVPADGLVLTQSPQNLVITFDQPLTAYNASFLDVQLYPVVDGVAQLSSPIFGSGTVQVPDEIADPPWAPPNGTVLEIPLQQDDLTLPGGTYEIDIVGALGLEQALSFPDVAPWNSNNNVVLAQFTVPDTGGVTLSQPTANLGTIGSTIQQVQGTLNSTDATKAVDLYQINLAAGHFWQLGLSVSTQSIGSPLLPALTLFNAQGNVIATSTTGLSSDPNEPFLFSGLSAGSLLRWRFRVNQPALCVRRLQPAHRNTGNHGSQPTGRIVPVELAGRAARPVHPTGKLQCESGGRARIEPNRADFELLLSDQLVKLIHARRTTERSRGGGCLGSSLALDGRAISSQQRESQSHFRRTATGWAVLIDRSASRRSHRPGGPAGNGLW